MWNGLNIMKRSLNARKGRRQKTPSSPNELAALLRPLYTQFLKNLGYESTPTPSEEQAGVLLAVMHKRAVQFEVPLDTRLSDKAFRLGFSEGLLAYPGHPVEVQAYIGLFTWIVVLIDDDVGRIKDDTNRFQQRFSLGEPQPHPLLHAMAELLREAYNYWHPILANILLTSSLNFLTSNLLETEEGFQKMPVTKAGSSFPYSFRKIAGIAEVYVIFGYPTAQYPKIEVVLEALLDMTLFINIFNDDISLADLGLGEKHPFPERLFIQAEAPRRNSGKQPDIENKEQTLDRLAREPNFHIISPRASQRIWLASPWDGGEGGGLMAHTAKSFENPLF
ncbi:hypothetical protein DL766_007382 [Monosporascus sp. MC13-8B]|uniref:Terpene synthase n=1 Tax=Monosporascus cannonballus TaxID=155416 RepID=A0ABY0H072_9PEZI|nr:hypothetical protein DL762_007217 [Monosporascus cannonballus]RYO88648.1 hypothetical protein DL763_005922 [Monosporascus cannonballus]RYP24083.1 hypothetical protein DL766_007382 [Monosporascus sp. MC13-8B]